MTNAKKLKIKIQNILKQNNITSSKMLSDLELNQNLITDLNKIKSLPTADKLIKIANYLSVSLDYLLDNEQIQEDKTIIKNIDSSIITSKNNNNTVNASKKDININCQDEQEQELLRLYRLLTIRDKINLMQQLYAVEEDQKNRTILDT